MNVKLILGIISLALSCFSLGFTVSMCIDYRRKRK